MSLDGGNQDRVTPIGVAGKPAVAGDMAERAASAAALLRALSHEGRLMILCHLVGAERSVGELEALLGSRQAAVSQQLARLRGEGIVRARREGKTIRYALADTRAARLIGLLYEMFCEEGRGAG